MLIETGEMYLSDGRKIVSTLKNNNTYCHNEIPIHPEFRMIVLANRPGFPFLGNDLFGAIGDLFRTHTVDNPSVTNEIELLKQYGPAVSEKVLLKLVKVFDELRTMADQGLVSYPYSTREVVNIVKHLQVDRFNINLELFKRDFVDEFIDLLSFKLFQEFPSEPLGTVVKNVFDFDKYSPEIFDTLVQIAHKHGIPFNTSQQNISVSKE